MISSPFSLLALGLLLLALGALRELSAGGAYLATLRHARRRRTRDLAGKINSGSRVVSADIS